MTDRYAPPSEHDVTRLVTAHPLAWLVSGAGESLDATLLPLRPSLDAEGRVVALLGHFARGNPHAARLREQARPRAVALFLGVHGYVSPSWMADRTQAPTWNYASVQYSLELDFVDEPARTREMVDDLVGAMEAGRPNAWAAAEMGPRYDRLARGVAAFEARVVGRHAKFKLGQDERDDVYLDIVKGLAGEDRADLLEWMARANPGRATG